MLAFDEIIQHSCIKRIHDFFAVAKLEGVKRMEKLGGRVLLADEQGLGKSLQSLLLLRRNKELRPALVVCPATIKWVWAREAMQHFGMRTTVLEGTRPKGGKTHDIVIINYDIVKAWLPRLLDLQPSMLIVDECHALANPKSIRSRNCKVLAKYAPYMLALSGTPLTVRPSQLWPVLNMLRPDLYPSFWKFAHAWCNPRRTPWGWDFSGASNLKLLHKELTRELMIRRRSVDVLHDLPELRRQVVPLDLPPKGRAEYAKALKNFIAWLIETAPRKAERARKAEALVKVGYIKRLIAWWKMKGVLAWCDDLLEDTGGKLILFFVHRKVMRKALKHFGKACVHIDGAVPQARRRAAVESFQDDPTIRVFVGQIKAAGTGITLTAATNVAFAELDWVPGNHSQAEKRPHRIGQTQAVVASYLIARQTIEEQIVARLQQRQEVLSKTLDGEVRKDVDLNIQDLLIAELERGEV